MENGAHSPSWSPDGGRIAFLGPASAEERAGEESDEDASSDPQDKLESKQRKERKAEDELYRWDPSAMWRIPYRQGTTYVDERYDQVYVVEAADSSDAKPRRLTDVNAAYSQPQWSADGASIFTSRTTLPQADEPWRSMNIYRLDTNSGEEEALTAGEFSAYAPLPSPDGKWLAYERSHIGVTDLPTRWSFWR